MEFRELDVSWFGTTRLGGVLLKDPKGATVANAPSVHLNRTLGQWIFGTSGTLILDLEGTALDVQRSGDGSINLAEALQTLLAHPDPGRDLAVKIKGGSLRYRDPALAETLVADALDLDLRIRPSPDPVSGTLRLAKGEDAGLEIQGDFDQWLSKGGPPRSPDLQLSVVGTRWPFEAKAAGLEAEGRLDGSLDFHRRRGRWQLLGDARVLELQAKGSPLNGDTLALDRLEAGWDLAEAADGWAIRRLSVTTPLGDLKAEGQLSGPSGTGHQKIEGRVDLAAIARQLPHALHLRDGLSVDRGAARLTLDIQGEPDQAAFDVEAHVSDLAARDGDRTLTLRDPATFNARLIRRGEESSLERLAVKTPFLDASAKGKLVEGVELAGTLDLGGLRKQLAEFIDFGKLELAGRGEFSGTYRLRPPGSPMSETERHFSARFLRASKIKPPEVLWAPMFEGHFKAALRDIQILGFGPKVIRRDSIRIEGASEGPSEASGEPLGWGTTSLTIASNDFNSRFILSPGFEWSSCVPNMREGRWQGLDDPWSRARPIDLHILATTTWATPAGRSGCGAHLAGTLPVGRRSLTIGDLSLEFNRPEGKSGGAWRASAKGQLDFSSGELALEQGSTLAPTAVILDPEGFHASGIGKGLVAIRVDGGFSGELAVLDEVLSELSGREPLGLTGRWSAQANARGDADGVRVAGKFGLDDTSDGLKPSRPTSVSASAHYSTASDRLDLSEFTVSTAYGTLDASGRIEDPAGARRLDLKGTLAPDFGAINALLAGRVEPGAKVEGKPRAFRASGAPGEGPGGRLSGLDAEVGFDLDGADIYGMKFGPSPIVLRAKGGKLSVDPISTTINEGHIRLEPEVDLDSPGGPMLRLAKNSAIREARINDEVSRRVLAFVAPVLDQATRARGLVSVDLDHAEFPIGRGRGRQAKVEGAVVFEDVEFAPGPLANDLLTAIGRRDASLKLDRPVTLTIADGRINQRGMSVPIGELTRIEMAGWVDFDRNLAITATLPVTASMLGNNPLLTDIAAGTLVKLPITGTLDRPVIDREAMASNLREMGRSLLTRGATRGAMELLMRLGRPRDPDAPPAPPRITPQERKALRQEKKAIRRGEVPANPPGEAPDRS